MESPNFAGNYFFRGLKLLWHPKLRLFALLPIIINIILMIALLTLSIHYFHSLVNWLLHFLPGWLDWLSWLLWLVFSISYLLIFTYTFTIITNIIGAPFNGLLAEKVQEMFGSRPASADMSVAQVIAATPRNVGRAAKSFLYFLPRAFLFLILLFIPLLQTIVPVLWFIFNAWMMSVQYIDYPMDNNKIGFKAMLKKLTTHRAANFSFGVVVLIGTMIPLLNLVVMPAAVIGATLLWIDQYKEPTKSPQITPENDIRNMTHKK
jgi:CysZ protein